MHTRWFLIALALTGAALACNLPNLPGKGTPARVIASYESRLLTPQEFTANAESLAAAVTDLNRAQLQFIQDAKASLAKENRERGIGLAMPLFADPETERLDQDLREIAARAMRVGRLADDLAQTMASQENGSDAAAKMAEPYSDVGRMAYALVIEAQNLRDDLAKGALKRADAVSRIAEFGARLWNVRVSGLDPNAKPVAGAVNPFVAEIPNAGSIAPVRFLSAPAAQQFQSQLASKSPRLWLAVAQDPITRTLSIPAPVKPVENVFDPALLDKLTDPAEQIDADRARQAAAALLDPGNPAGARQIQIALKTAAVADPDAIAAVVIPSFDNGTGTTVSLQKGVIGDDLIEDISVLSGIEAPQPGESKLIIPADKLVALSISNVSVDEMWVGEDAADVKITFQVEWQARIIPAADWLLLIQCTSLRSYRPRFEVKERAGNYSDNVELLRIPYPGEVTLTCKSFLGDLSLPPIVNSDPRFAASVSTLMRIGKESTPTATATPTATPTATTPTATPAPTSVATATPIKGRIVIDYYKAQSSRKDAGEALREPSDACVPEVTISPDGTVSGQCENKDAHNSGPSYYVMTALVIGQADTQSGSFSFTYEVTEIGPTFAFDGGNVTWRIAYSGLGKFTSATDASGMANFSYSCKSSSDSLRWCGQGGGSTSESFTGTVPWNFGPPK